MSNIKITKFRAGSLWTSVHFTIGDRLFYYNYDNTTVCCNEYKLNEIIDGIYYTIREDGYCSYDDTLEQIKEKFDKSPVEAKEIREYLETYNGEEIG